MNVGLLNNEFFLLNSPEIVELLVLVELPPSAPHTTGSPCSGLYNQFESCDLVLVPVVSVVERINTQGISKNGEWRMENSLVGSSQSRESTQRSIHWVARLRGGYEKTPRGILKIYKIGCIQRHERGKYQRNRRVWPTPIESVDYFTLTLLPMDPIDPIEPLFIEMFKYSI